MKFEDIPEIPIPVHTLDVPWMGLEEYMTYNSINLCPDFHRGEVWTVAQQSSFIEFCLRGGEQSVITSNCYRYCDRGWREPDHILVDGLQRITSVRKFLSNQLKVFGRFRQEYEGPMSRMRFSFRWKTRSLEDPADVIKLYVALNTAVTQHSAEEIDKALKALSGLTRGLAEGERDENRDKKAGTDPSVR